MLRAVFAGVIAAVLAVPLPASATWSIIAVDKATGKVAIASASMVAVYSMQPCSARTAAVLARKASSTLARWPGWAVMTATTWIMRALSS